MVQRAHSLQIITPRGRNLAWTADDRLWLLRAVEAEGEPRDLVAQTLVNRWAWAFDELPAKYLNLWELVRAYARSVNPAWFPEGKAFQGHLALLPELEHAKALAKATLRRDVHATRTTFSSNTITAVDQALEGPLTIPIGALHYAPPSEQRAEWLVLVPSIDGIANVIYSDSQRGSRARYTLAAPGSAGPSPQGRLAVMLIALFSFGLGTAQVGQRK